MEIEIAGLHPMGNLFENMSTQQDAATAHNHMRTALSKHGVQTTTVSARCAV